MGCLMEMHDTGVYWPVGRFQAAAGAPAGPSARSMWSNARPWATSSLAGRVRAKQNVLRSRDTEGWRSRASCDARDRVPQGLATNEEIVAFIVRDLELSPEQASEPHDKVLGKGTHRAGVPHCLGEDEAEGFGKIERRSRGVWELTSG